MPKMIATDKHPRALPGSEVHVSSSMLRFSRKQGWVVPAEEVKKADEDAALDALRADYERLSGEKARSNWKAETLRTKVEDARKTYMRRDMRAED